MKVREVLEREICGILEVVNRGVEELKGGKSYKTIGSKFKDPKTPSINIE